MRGIVPIPFVVILVSGCDGGPLSTADDQVTVSVQDADVLIEGEAQFEATFAVAIRNGTAAQVWYHECGTVLERYEEGTWKSVWHSVCRLDDVEEMAILSRETLLMEFAVEEKLGSRLAADWKAPLDGQYRLGVAVRGIGGTLPISDRTSEPFTLRPQ
jgi:hypothetical protein